MQKMGSKSDVNLASPSAEGPNGDFQIALAAGGGVLPARGCYSSKVWGIFLGLSPQRVREWVREFDIPFSQPGAEIFIDAADMRKAFVKRQGAELTGRRGSARPRRNP